MNPLRAAILRGARATARPGGAVRGSRPGDGFAFAQLRAYVEGDDPRRIDAAATARAGALQTRVYVEETVLVLAALVDESGSMRVGRRRPLSAAADEALRAWFGALEGEDRAARIVDEGVVRDRRAAALVRAAAPFRCAAALAVAQRALPHGASLLLIADGFDLPPRRRAGTGRAALRRDRAAGARPVARRPAAARLRAPARRRDRPGGARVRRPPHRARYREAARAREAALHERFRGAGWRVGALDERDGRASLLRAFGLPP